MASPSTPATTTTFALPRLRDLIEHDEDDDSVEDEEEGDDDEEEDWDIRNRMSLLTVEGSDGGDADDEDDGSADVDEEEDEDEVRSAGVHGEYESQPWHPYESPRNHLKPPSSASLPGTPERGAPSQSPWRYSKDYASETEAGWWPGAPHDKRGQHYRRQRMMREVWLDRAWQTRKQRRMLGERSDEVTVMVGKGGESPARGGVGVAMDLEEVRACKDLGFDLPCDWTVEIPSYAVPNADTASSGGNSPASGSWRISSPGDDPKDVKARLKVWAQAVALTSTSRLGS